jgi:hypothetical protein
MAKLQLVHLAHARSGDKGNRANVGIIAYDPAHFPILKEALTPERVKEHFGEMVEGKVERFELPNLHALNFVLHDALEGGGTVSLMTDAQAKVTATAFLRMEIEVPDSVAEVARGRGRVPKDVAERILSGTYPGPMADSGRSGEDAE